MADVAEQTAREDGAGTSAEDFKALRERAQRAEAGERSAREAAAQLEQQRNQLWGRAQEEVNRRVASDETALAQAIAAATSEGEAAEHELTDAIAANDAAAIAKAQRRLNRADMNLNTAQQNNGRLQAWKKQEIERRAAAEEQAKSAPRQERQTGDEIDISAFSAPTQKWLRDHPSLIKNTLEAEADRDTMIGWHKRAVARGVKPDTSEYFKFLDEHLPESDDQQGSSGRDRDAPTGLREGEVEIDLSRKPDERSKDEGTRVADRSGQQPNWKNNSALPPQRPTVPQSPRNDGRIRLTEGEQQAARASWPHLPADESYREYAINKQKLISEGRL